jgi:hypothetical protein
MKKIVVLWAMFCIISPKIFTDENNSEIKKYYFPWQLYNYFMGDNGSSSILVKYPYKINDIKINLPEDTGDICFLDYIYLNNGELAYNVAKFFYYQYKVFEFFYNITGGPERQRREQLESDRRYNILHPAEPPRRSK